MVETYWDFSKYATPGNKMITRMLHLPPEKKKVFSEHDIQSVKVHTVEHKIDNRSDYGIVDQI